MSAFTINNLITSVAAQLKERWPGLPVYDSRTPQGTRYPCFYVHLMPSGILDQIDGIEMRNVALDVIYVQQRNIVNADAELLEIADALDELLDYIQYTDGGEPVPLHTHDRTYSIEDQELHYKLEVRQRVGHARNNIKIQQVEECNVEIES